MAAVPPSGQQRLGQRQRPRHESLRAVPPRGADSSAANSGSTGRARRVRAVLFEEIGRHVHGMTGEHGRMHGAHALQQRGHGARAAPRRTAAAPSSVVDQREAGLRLCVGGVHLAAALITNVGAAMLMRGRAYLPGITRSRRANQRRRSCRRTVAVMRGRPVWLTTMAMPLAGTARWAELEGHGARRRRAAAGRTHTRALPPHHDAGGQPPALQHFIRGIAPARPYRRVRWRTAATVPPPKPQATPSALGQTVTLWPRAQGQAPRQLQCRQRLAERGLQRRRAATGARTPARPVASSRAPMAMRHQQFRSA